MTKQPLIERKIKEPNIGENNDEKKVEMKEKPLIVQLKKVNAPTFEKENVCQNITIPERNQISKTQTTPCTPEKRILVNLNMHTIQKPIIQKHDRMANFQKVKKV